MYVYDISSLRVKKVYNTEFVSMSEKNVIGFVARKGTAHSTGRVIGPQNFVYVDCSHLTGWITSCWLGGT